MTTASTRGRRPAVHRGVELHCDRRFEDDARTTGHALVAGVDEVGRGALSFSIAAASIVAKFTRDGLMRELARQHPGYGLARNMGYGSEGHRNAVRRPGPSAIHRRSFHGTQAWLIS